MEDAELSQKVRAGEIDAFEQWMDIYSGDIERFAIQYGCTLRQAVVVTGEIFRNFYNQLESYGFEKPLIEALYKHAVNGLSDTRQTNSPNETIFLFEEDQELHDKIVNLETDRKVPFILSKFHHLDDVSIAAILDTTEETIEQAIAEAFQDLEIVSLKKRLEFLTKSYDRLKTTFKKEQVFAKSQKAVQTTGKAAQSISKKAMISWVAGVFVLLSLLIVPVVTSEEYKKASAEKYIERLKVSFEKEVGNRYTELGLTEPTVGSEAFNHAFYGEKERADFESMMLRYEGVMSNTGTLNKKKVEEEYREIIKSLELPSEMTKRLFKKSLADDLEKSDTFMKGYLERFYLIQQSYFEILFKHEQIIEDAVENGIIDIEAFMKKKDTYPEDLQFALGGMIKQNIYPMSIKNWAPIAPIFKKNEHSAKIRTSIHPELEGYLTGLEAGPMVMYPGLVHSLEDSIDYLLEIEKTLLATTLTDELTNNLSWSYSELFYEIIGGTEPDQVFDTNGKVKMDYRAGWERIASAGKSSPAAYLMQKINSEMEATDWTESNSHSQLESYDVHQALELAKFGRLDTFSMQGLRKNASGFESVSFPDTFFEELVKETYHSFSSNYDQSTLEGISPLVIIGVYLYANEREDSETMWRLYSTKNNTATLEEYTAQWSLVEIAIDSYDGLHFNSEGETTGSIGFQQGNMTVYLVQMVLEDETVWRISHADLDLLLHEFEN